MLTYIYDSSGNLLTATTSSVETPLIISQPISVIAAPGDSATFSVVVTDAHDVTFQWKRNGHSAITPRGTGAGPEANLARTVLLPSKSPAQPTKTVGGLGENGVAVKVTDSPSL